MSNMLGLGKVGTLTQRQNLSKSYAKAGVTDSATLVANLMNLEDSDIKSIIIQNVHITEVVYFEVGTSDTPTFEISVKNDSDGVYPYIKPGMMIELHGTFKYIRFRAANGKTTNVGVKKMYFVDV